MPCGHLNAMRFDQKPLPQPGYTFAHVPKAKSDLEHSSLQRIANREDFQFCMGEMLLLSKEAVRRRKERNVQTPVVTNSAAKPLSLEYIADRMDIDEPCFGYVVRTQKQPSDKESNNAGSFWKEGMLQGFITITCFTNWQKTFKFDSLHPEAYSFDSDSLTAQRKNGIRKWDQTGELARALQQTVHKGDIWNEGIVWPRIAEISLLGALGCGKTLVKLAIEHLEKDLKPNAEQNYDYVVLQATDNSVPFYESLGFVRVGGIMEATKQDEEEAPLSEIVSSETTPYVTQKRGELPLDIAKKHKVDVWDLLFLNKAAMPEIKPKSKLLLGTTLEIPVPTPQPRAPPTRTSTRNNANATSPKKGKDDEEKDERTTILPLFANNPRAETDSEGITWYLAKENDTPTKISKMFRINGKELVQANSLRLPGLMGKSRLKNGTRVQISHFDRPSKMWTAYAHWSFPDNKTEAGEPSYMMCYKLNKGSSTTKKGNTTRPVLESLQTGAEDYKVSPLLLMPPDESASKLTIEGNTAQSGTRPIDLSPAAPTVLQPRDTNRESLPPVKSSSDGEMLKPSAIQSKTAVSGNTMVPNASLSQSTTPKPQQKQAVGAFVLFCKDMRERKKELLNGLSIADASRVLADRWRAAPLAVKQKFETLALELKPESLAECARQVTPHCDEVVGKPAEKSSVLAPAASDSASVINPTVSSSTASKKKDRSVLFNKVVKLRPEAIPFTARRSTSSAECKEGAQTEGYKYWFCLTFVPDLQWVHLIPMEKCGTFEGEDKKLPTHLIGMTKWKLIDETQNGAEDEEIELSSRYVIPVKSRETRKSADANKEEWAIFDEGTSLGRNSKKSGTKRSRVEDPRAKPTSTKKRKQEANDPARGTDVSAATTGPPASSSGSSSAGTKYNKSSLGLLAGAATVSAVLLGGGTNGTNCPSGSSSMVTSAPHCSAIVNPAERGSVKPFPVANFPETDNNAEEQTASFSMKLPPMDLDLSLIGQEASTSKGRTSPTRAEYFPPSMHSSHQAPYPAHPTPQYPAHPPYHPYSHPNPAYQHDPRYHPHDATYQDEGYHQQHDHQRYHRHQDELYHLHDGTYHHPHHDDRYHHPHQHDPRSYHHQPSSLGAEQHHPHYNAGPPPPAPWRPYEQPHHPIRPPPAAGRYEHFPPPPQREQVHGHGRYSPKGLSHRSSVGVVGSPCRATAASVGCLDLDDIARVEKVAL